jgi:hypothetical protein
MTSETAESPSTETVNSRKVTHGDVENLVLKSNLQGRSDAMLE